MKLQQALQVYKPVWVPLALALGCDLLGEGALWWRSGLDPDTTLHYRLTLLAGTLFLGFWLFTVLAVVRFPAAWRKVPPKSGG